MVTYDKRGMSWDQWCKLTSEQFASQSLGTLPEERWKIAHYVQRLQIGG